MDPELANLNFDPPKQASPLRRGLLPALLVHVAFFIALALSLQWNRDSPSDTLATRSAAPTDTRSMGAGPAPVEPGRAADVPATTPAPGANGPAASATPAPAAVAPMQAVPQAPARAPAAAPAGRRSEAAPRAPESRAARPAVNATPVAHTEARPSFDCARARSRSERLICSDRELAALDRDTGRLHARAKAAARDPAAFQRQNDAAWKQREATCRDKPCLLAWYSHRRAQLQQVVARAR